MPLFERSRTKLTPVEQKNFALEKELKTLIESNLAVVFNCRLVASEFYTGSVHNGYIDSLALSEENNPVIIEYKKVESSEQINQSLFYRHWIRDHKGDFEIAVQKALGNKVKVDWSDGHFGTGDSESTISAAKDLADVVPFLELAYNKVGG